MVKQWNASEGFNKYYMDKRMFTQKTKIYNWNEYIDDCNTLTTELVVDQKRANTKLTEDQEVQYFKGLRTKAPIPRQNLVQIPEAIFHRTENYDAIEITLRRDRKERARRKNIS